MRIIIKFFGILVAILFSTIAHSAYIEFDVDASTNSSSISSGTNGVGLNTGFNYNVGDAIIGFVDQNDLWSAGALPRWSNADGLVIDLFATGSDDSGQSAGIQIGADFGLWDQNGLSAPYGSLVGEINNTFFVLGTNFNIAAPASGVLSLYYWDSNSGNEGLVTVSIDNEILPAGEPGASAIPVPAAVWLFVSGLFGLMVTRKHS